MPELPGAVTQLLIAWSGGDRQALDSLVPIVNAELRRIAGGYLKRENAGHLLQPTALVNEAYLRLIDQRVAWQNRAQFYGIAAQLMRRVLIDHARHRKRLKRGGGHAITVSLEGIAADGDGLDRLDIIALDRALAELTALDPEAGRLVELRFFAGLTFEEIAEAMEISLSTVKRRWRSARAWLHRDLTGSGRA